MFVLFFMVCFGVISFWNGWSVIGEIGLDFGFWFFEGVVVVYIVLFGLLFLVVVWYWVFWDLELFVDFCIGEFVGFV